MWGKTGSSFNFLLSCVLRNGWKSCFAWYVLLTFIAFRKYVGEKYHTGRKWGIPSVFNSKIAILTPPDSDFLAIDTVLATYKK